MGSSTKFLFDATPLFSEAESFFKFHLILYLFSSMMIRFDYRCVWWTERSIRCRQRQPWSVLLHLWYWHRLFWQSPTRFWDTYNARAQFRQLYVLSHAPDQQAGNRIHRPGKLIIGLVCYWSDWFFIYRKICIFAPIFLKYIINIFIQVIFPNKIDI